MFLWGPSTPRGEPCHDGDWGGGPSPPNLLILIPVSLVPAEVETATEIGEKLRQ